MWAPTTSNTTTPSNKRYLIAILIALLIAGVGTAISGRPSIAPSSDVSIASIVSEHTNLPTEIETTQALMVTKSISTGEAFDPSSIEIATMPVAATPEDAVTSAEELEGYVALGPVSAGSIITRLNLGTAVAILPKTIPPQLPKFFEESFSRSCAQELATTTHDAASMGTH